MLRTFIDQINQRLRDLAAAHPRAVLNRQLLPQGEGEEPLLLVGYRAQFVIRAVNEILGSENWTAEATGEAPLIISTRLREPDGEWPPCGKCAAASSDGRITDRRAIATDTTCKSLSLWGVAEEAYLGLIRIEEDFTGLRYLDLDEEWDATDPPEPREPTAADAVFSGPTRQVELKPNGGPVKQGALAVANRDTLAVALYQHYLDLATPNAGGNPALAAGLAKIMLYRATEKLSQAYPTFKPPVKYDRKLDQGARELLKHANTMVLDLDALSEEQLRWLHAELCR